MLKDRKVKKILFLAVMLFVLVGCKANLDKNGQILAERVIDNNTAWSLSQGWFDFLIVMPIAKLILLFENWTGIVWAIIIVTILTNLITLPLMVKSTVMSQKMQMLQPQLDRIQNKYRGRNDQTSKARMSAELNALYKKNGIKMGQAMFMPFLSMPIMIAMWQAVQRIPSVYDASFLGLKLGEMPLGQITSGHWQYLILIVLLALFQYGSMEINNQLQKRSTKYKAPKQNNQMKLMNIYMMVLIIFMSLNMPTAMSIYWIVTALIAIIRSVYIHYQHTEKMKIAK